MQYDRIYGALRVEFRISGNTEGLKLSLGRGGLCSNGCRRRGLDWVNDFNDFDGDMGYANIVNH